ncbi:MAG: glycerol-3-phosphate acyltransferase [Anaerolineae bacterium]
MIGLWVVVAFLAGSLPFSVWLGRMCLGTDIREFGDGNPGAANAWKAGGWRVGVGAVLLDWLKAAAPVGLAFQVGQLSGWEIVPVALAPVLGHAFSPFLRFRGGKAVAVTFGVWTGLTLWEGPTVLGLLFGFFYYLQSNDGWSVLLGMLSLGGYWGLRQAEPWILVVWGGDTLILAWKHRHELRQPIRLRPWIANRVRREQ